MKILFIDSSGNEVELSGNDQREIMETYISHLDTVMIVMDDEGNELDENGFPL